ncbi:MAG: hypothetical protein D3924_08065 [Candidatus Electrothrix sp. AR4]|nr:hypothetical protein [Candidatus Electrothrix sp. AR4]
MVIRKSKLKKYPLLHPLYADVLSSFSADLLRSGVGKFKCEEKKGWWCAQGFAQRKVGGMVKS